VRAIEAAVVAWNEGVAVEDATAAPEAQGIAR
jgi:hypothetical protein